MLVIEMATKVGFNSIGKWLLLCGWVVLFIGGGARYTGSWLTYTLFSLAFLAMLLVAFYKEFNYGYIFLSVLLFLGFWIKLTIHLIFPAPYIEPIGLFSHSSAAWDEVLWVATATAMGLVVVRLIWVALPGFIRFYDAYQYDRITVPVWYVSSRKFLWAGVLVLIAFFAIVNAKLGIHQIGLAPRTILIFPLNALIAWMLNFGLATIIATFLWWDVQIHMRPLLSIYVVLAEAIFSSVSMLSRGAFIFHIIPQFIAYYRNRKRFISLTLRKILSMLLVTVVFFALGFSTVDTLRGYYYRSNTEDFRSVNQQNEERLKVKRQEKELLEARLKKYSEAEPEPNTTAELGRLERELTTLEARTSAAQQELQVAAQSITQRFRMLVTEFWIQWPSVLSRVLSLATERWIGLEGVMALQSYPSKSMALLREGLAERYADGVVPMYQHISKSIYTGMDPNQWKFGSLPGAPAFLYYSGSLLIVFLGMAMVTALLHLIEISIKRCTENPFLVSFYGFVAANLIAQFGVVPRQTVPVAVTLAGGIAFVGFVQSGLGVFILNKIFRHNTRKN